MPSKSKKSQPLEDPFLFIHEDPSIASSAPRDPSVDRNKQSYVQRRSFELRRKQKRKQDELRRTEENANVRLSPQKPHSTVSDPGPIPRVDLATLLQRYPGLALSQRLGSRESEPQDHSTSSNSEPEPGQNDQELKQRWIQNALYHTRRELAAPLHCSQRISGIDLPYDEFYVNSHTSLAKFAKPLIHYFVTTALYVIRDMPVPGLEPMPYGDEIHADLQSTMSEPAQMYALLAYSAAAMLQFEGRLTIPGVNPEHHSHHHGIPLFFRTKTLEALRVLLANNHVNQNTITVARRLTAASLIAENYEAMYIHHHALWSMIEEVGGILTLSGYHMELTIHLDLTYATRTGEKPLFQPVWDPGPFEDAQPASIVVLPPYLSDTGFRIAWLAEQEDFISHPDTAEVIHALLQTQVVSQWLDIQQQYPREYFRWLIFRRLAIFNRLLRIRSEIKMESVNDVASAKTWLLFLGLIYYIILSFCFPIGARLVRFYQPIFPPRLLWLKDFTENLDADLQLWIIVLAGIGSLNAQADMTKFQANLTTDANGIGQISNLGVQLCIKLGIRSIAELEFMLRGFLFREDLLQVGRFRDFAKVFLNLQNDTEVGSFLSQDFIPLGMSEVNI